MSGLGDLFRWCAKAIPVIITVAEAASKIAKHIGDTVDSLKKTSSIIDGVGSTASAKTRSGPRAEPSAPPNVMDSPSAPKTELSEIVTIINEQGKRLDAATS